MRASRRIRIPRRRWPAASLAALGLVGLVGTAGATHLASDTQGHTTLEQTLVPSGDPAAGYTDLTLGPGESSYVLRDEAENPAIPDALSGRETRRTSLAYFTS